jgi:hypothetical protein
MRSGRQRHWLLATLLGLAACGGTETKGGELIVSVSTDMSVPEDITAIRIVITVRGDVRHDAWYEVGPKKDVLLPATLGIVRGKGDDPVTIRVMSRLKNGVRTLREVVTTVPEDRVAHLPIKVEWLCDGQVKVSVGKDGSENVSSTCPDKQTCIAGECKSVVIDSSTLSNYEHEKVFGGAKGKGACFDTLGCFAQEGKTLSAPRESDCSLDAEELGKDADGKGASLALVLPPRADGGDEIGGICTKDACLVPLDRDSESGWSIKDGRALLPKSVCKRLGDDVNGIALSRACAPKTESLPTCGPWSAITEQKASDPDKVILPDDLTNVGAGGAGGTGADGGGGGAGAVSGAGGEGPGRFDGCAFGDAIPTGALPAGAALVRTLDSKNQTVVNLDEYWSNPFTRGAASMVRASACDTVGALVSEGEMLHFYDVTAGVSVPDGVSFYGGWPALFFDPPDEQGGCAPYLMGWDGYGGFTEARRGVESNYWNGNHVPYPLDVNFPDWPQANATLADTTVGRTGRPHLFLRVNGPQPGDVALVHVTRDTVPDATWQFFKLPFPTRGEVLGMKVGPSGTERPTLHALYRKSSKDCVEACDHNLYYGRLETSGRAWSEERVETVSTSSRVSAASLAVDQRDEGIVAATFETYEGAALKKSELRVYGRRGGAWCSEFVVDAADQFTGADKVSLTGAHPHIAIDPQGRIYVTFSDVAQWNTAAGPERIAGSARLAFRTLTGWSVQTLYRQPDQAKSPQPLHVWRSSAVVPAAGGKSVYVAGAEYVWNTATTQPPAQTYPTATVRARVLQLGSLSSESCSTDAACDDKNSCTVDACEPSKTCSHIALPQCSGPELESAATCGCTGAADCCSGQCTPGEVNAALTYPSELCPTVLNCCQLQQIAAQNGLPKAGPFPSGYYLSDDSAGCQYRVTCVNDQGAGGAATMP